MAKKIGEHGDNRNRTAQLGHPRHEPAVAPEFGGVALGEKRKDFR
jgi:hypothetical protein